MVNDHTLRVYDSILGLLCNEENPTPLVRLNKVVPFKHTQVFAKLEWFNPFGAVKDRVAANMIEDAEQRGVLEPGKKLVEATSGNTGLGMAMIGNQKGYPLQTTLSQAIPLEKRTVLRFFGSEVVELDDTLCPAPGAPEGAIAKAHNKAKTDPEYEILDQYANEANPAAHYRTTGPEIWRQTEGKVTHFVAGLGTCGTITGNGRFLKQQNAAIHVLGVSPEEGHDIPGVRSQRQLAQTKLYFPDEYDGQTEVINRDAFDMCLRLNREESIIAGPSSGMALVGALRLVPDEPGNIAVVIFPDDIFKYASSIVRHFPELAPPAEKEADSSAPSKNDRFLADLMEGMAEEKLCQRVGIRSYIEHLVLADAGEGATGDVAHRIAAGLAGGDADGGQAAHQRGSIVNMDEMQLEILPSRDMGDPIRVFLCQLGQHLQLLRIYSSVRDLDPLHPGRVPDRTRPLGGMLRRIGQLLGLVAVMALAIIVSLAVHTTAEARLGKHLFVNLALPT